LQKLKAIDSVEQLITEKNRQCLRQGFQVWPELEYGKMPALGDFRWTADLIYSTWAQAGSGKPPENGLEWRVGNSGGGFDVLDFKFLEENKWLGADAAIDLSIPLNRKAEDAQIVIPIPFYGAGMSYGSISEQVMLSRAKAARAWKTYTSTGEGGYPASVVEYKDNVITQVATGMFGVREETIQYAPIVEFKYAQGAKPGLGGHLLGDKATSAVAQMRESVPWVSLFSPFPFHSVYSVEDHKKHLDWVRTVNPRALVSVKVSTPTDVDMVAVGSYYAGANIVHIDGSYGGTGAAPEIAKKNIAMPIEFAIPKVHRYLVQEGIRDEIVMMASGGIRTAYDIAERHHLHKPVMEQPEYNLLHRKRVENEYKRLYEDIGLGLTTWSPLASGLLTGKYRDGVPSDSRAQLQGYEWLSKKLTDKGANNIVGKLAEVSDQLGCSLAQLSLAWILLNPHVSTVITGASRVEQIHENMKAIDVVQKITPEIKQRIEEIVGDAFV